MSPNVLEVEYPPLVSCPAVEDADEIVSLAPSVATDESSLGFVPPEVVFFPRDTFEVSAAVREARRRGLKVVVSGGRTGICGGAVVVDEGCALVSLERLKAPPSIVRSGQGWVMDVAAGITLEEVEACCRREGGKLWYPVDPTERGATVGGTVATNASGSRSFRYGQTRRWIDGLVVVLADGGVVRLRRVEFSAEEGRFLFVTADGVVEVPVTDVRLPRSSKHAMGYRLSSEMDAVDLFVGAEGTLGIVTEVRIRLTERPSIFACYFFDEDEESLLELCRMLRAECDAILAIEYADGRCGRLIKERWKGWSGLPDLGDFPDGQLYVETSFHDEEALAGRISRLGDAAVSCGVSPSRAWASPMEDKIHSMKKMRHAVPEVINGIIRERRKRYPALHKVAMDMCVSFDRLPSLLSIVGSRLREAGLESVVFGHIGDAHLHVNVLPHDDEDVAVAKRVHLDVAREVAGGLEGSVSAEHGVGRLKKYLVSVQFDAGSIEAMKRVKAALDPDCSLNPGVLWE